MVTTRRSFGCMATALAATASLGDAAAAKSEWTVLQPAPMTGVNGGVGWHLRLGAMLAFQTVNAAGGVQGKPLRLLTLDEERGRVAAQVSEAARQSGALALLGLNGRRALGELAQSGLMAELGLPVVGVKSGSGNAPGFGAPWLFITRGGYRVEIEQLLRHAATTYSRRVALVTTQDEDGDEITTLARAQAIQHGLELLVAPRHPTDTAQVSEAVAAVLATPHSAVLLATNTAAVAYFAKLYRAERGRGQLMTMSSAEATQLALVVGAEAARGMIISQIVPYPRDPKVPLMREFMAAWRRFTPTAVDPTMTMAEGYVAARVLIAGLQRCGPNATGPALAAALTQAARTSFDLGGLRISLQHDGPHFRTLSVLGGDGRVVF